MQKFLSLIFLLVFSFLPSLFADGPFWQIALPPSPSVTEKTAAEELQSHIKLMTGTELPIYSESDISAADGHVLYVGATEYAKLLLKTDHPDPFLFDEIYIKAVGDNLVLVGHERRGTLYAVYTFLEDVCGFRWFTPDVVRVPTLSTFSFPADLSISYAPKLHYREIYNAKAQESLFSARNKGNGNIDPQHGGRISLLNGVHSFFRLIPPEKYYGEHPDWFSEIDGKRTAERTQLCLTNDEMRLELTRNVLEQLRANPGTTIVDISQNDQIGFCTCEKCRAVDEEEESHAGTLIRFLNQVAADIEAEFPDLLVETLAYQYTRKPPKLTKPRKNLLIRLCSIECDFARPFTDPSNTDFLDDISGWSRIAPNLFVWDYVTNYEDYIGPHPNWRVLAPNIRTMTEHHVNGLFEEGEGDDFCEMKNWVLMKLMWNPDLDTRVLMEDFSDTYCGKEATPYIMKYWDILLDAAEKSGISIGCFYAHAWRWIDIQTLNAATEQMRMAENAVQQESGVDSEEYYHLRKSRLALDSIWLRYYAYWKSESLRLNQPFEGPVDFKAAAKQFSDISIKARMQGPSLPLVGHEGKVWFEEFPNGTFSLKSYPFGPDWTSTPQTTIENSELLLNGTDGRVSSFYTAGKYIPTEIIVEFLVEPNGNRGYFGVIFGTENGRENIDQYSYLALDRDNVVLGEVVQGTRVPETFNKPAPSVTAPWEYGKWHQAHIIFGKNLITLYVDNQSVFQWLPYPDSGKRSGQFGFFAENAAVSIRNVFFAGYKLE